MSCSVNTLNGFGPVNSHQLSRRLVVDEQGVIRTLSALPVIEFGKQERLVFEMRCFERCTVQHLSLGENDHL